MKPGKTGKGHQPQGDADWRARFDGIEHTGGQQVDALRRLALESKTAASGVIRDGRLIALQGHFATDTPDPIQAVTAFLAAHVVALGVDVPGRNDTFATPRFVDCEQARPRDVDTILFPHQVRGVPTYRAGVSVEVDRGGSVRLLQALIPAPMPIARGSKASGARKAATSARVSKGRSATRARKAVATLLGDDDLPDPTFELFDPALIFGESGEPVGVWVFDIRRNAPVHVLVEDGRGELVRIINNPGCPVGTLPIYHLNRITSAPDMVLFPGAGLLLPEAATGNPATVARAVFERYPKMFGTGDPSSQLALREVLTGPDQLIPTTTVVFDQLWSTLPIFGCELRVHLSRALAVTSISGNFLRDPGVPTTPAVSQSAARISAWTTALFEAPVRIDPDALALTKRTARAPDSQATTGEGAYLESEPPPPGEQAGLPPGTEGKTSTNPLVAGFDRLPPAGGEYEPWPGYTDREARAAALRLAGDYHRELSRDPNLAATIGVPGIEDRGLAILPTALTRSGNGQNHLAWWFRFRDADRFISAVTGAQVLLLSRVQTAERVFDAAATNLPAVGVNVQFIDGNTQVPAANLDPDAQATAGATSTVASFWRGFRRESWDGRGGDMDAYVDWQALDLMGNPINNAQWDGSQTMYSPQWSTPDIVGHEFTHGLIQATAGLVYVDESGAANEHYADLFGNLIFPDVLTARWLVGEDIPTGRLRDMRNPVVRTYQNYRVSQPTRAGDFGGVHTNSGILNRAAVLMCDGNPPARPGGIGRSRLARLAWETLVFRLHRFASFSDVMHLTWAVSRDLAATGALGAPGIPGVTGLPPAFDTGVTDQVVWAFQQVGLVLDVQSGWHDVTVNTPFEPAPGTTGFEATETLYPGQTLTNGRTLIDMEVRLFRRNMLNGSLRMSTGGVFNAADRSFSAQIVSASTIGTANLETQVRVTSPTALSVFMSPVPTIREPAAPPTAPVQPPITSFDTPRMAHSLDYLPFGGRYDDVLFEGVQLPFGCFVTDVELRVLGLANIVSPGGDGTYLAGSTTTVGVNVGEDHMGAHMISRTLGGRSLEVRVHSWHDAYVAVRYILRYSVAGNITSLPAFTARGL